MNNPTSSLIIVHYKNKLDTFNVISSILKTTSDTNIEIIVVDNDEISLIREELLTKFPKVKYIQNNKNIGYSAGNNIGAKCANGKYLLVLNPDTKFIGDTLNQLARFLDNNKNTAIVAPNLVNSKGELHKVQECSELTPIKGVFALSFLNKIFPNNPFSNSYYQQRADKSKKREASAVPGSAFMIRRGVFKKIGGFDENYFLYFEEADIGKRVKALGYKIFMIPDAVVMHKWLHKGKRNKKLQKHFNKSRFYYFKKHFGLSKALMVEFFARFSKYWALMTFILALGVVLRFYNLQENMYFGGETGHNYLQLKNYVENRQFPLVGPPTGHSWISLGPLFYWIMIPLFYIGGFLPEVGAYFFAFIGVLLIIINYATIATLVNRNIALLSSAIVAFSPGWLELARGARFYFLAVLFFYPFVYFLHRSISKSGKYLFHTMLFLAVMLNFHLSVMILFIPISILVYIKRDRFKKNDLLYGILGFAIPTIPFLITSLQNKLDPIIKIIAWVPYRVLGFLGLYPKNNLTEEVVNNSLATMNYFLTSQYFWKTNVLTMLIFIAFTLYVSYYIFTDWKKKDFGFRFVLSLIYLTGIGALFIHGGSPIHYFMPFYATAPILIAYLVMDILNKNNFKLIIAIVLLLLFVNINYYTNEWFFYYKNHSIPDFVSYPLQKKVVKSIVKDADGSRYSLIRSGPFDFYGGYYAQNYQYLLWLYGNEPKEQSGTVYTIYEGISFQPKTKSGELIFSNEENSMTVYKYYD